MIRTIWERYFLTQFFRMLFFFLFCLYGLFVLIDYASHAGTFSLHKGHLHWQDIVRYYLYVFVSRAEILLPIALLIAFIHTVCSLNTHSELAAFMAGGFSLKTLMRPFVLVGILAVTLMYANEQFLLPDALRKLRRIEDMAKHQKHRYSSEQGVSHLILDDKSLLLFQNYDSSLERFFDVYWIESTDSIYRMKYLSPLLSGPIGYFVDHFVRGENGTLTQEKAYKELLLPEIKFNQDLMQSTIFDPDILPLTELAEQAAEIPKGWNEKESKLLTAYYWKLAMPWLCLLAIIAPAPYCVRFSRNLPIFLIYAFSLFGLIAFYTFLDGAQVVAKRQVASPFLAVCSPFIAALSYFGWRFYKL